MTPVDVMSRSITHLIAHAARRVRRSIEPTYPPRVSRSTQIPAVGITSLPRQSAAASPAPPSPPLQRPNPYTSQTPVEVRLDPLSFLTQRDVDLLNDTTGSRLTWPVQRRSCDVFPAQAADVGMVRGLQKHGYADQNLAIALRDLNTRYVAAGTRYPHEEWLLDALTWLARGSERLSATSSGPSSTPAAAAQVPFSA